MATSQRKPPTMTLMQRVNGPVETHAFDRRRMPRYESVCGIRVRDAAAWTLFRGKQPSCRTCTVLLP
jgi:hypothetical protein